MNNIDRSPGRKNSSYIHIALLFHLFLQRNYEVCSNFFNPRTMCPFGPCRGTINSNVSTVQVNK